MKYTFKRVFSFIIDVTFTVIGTLFFSAFSMLFGLLSILIMPLISPETEKESYELLNQFMEYASIIGFVAFVVIYASIVVKVNRTIGYAMFYLKMQVKDTISVFIKFFIYYGSISLLVYSIVFLGLDKKLLLYVLPIYILYLLIDVVVLTKSNGRETFTDRWLGITVQKVVPPKQPKTSKEKPK